MGFNVNIRVLIKRAKNLRFLGTASFGCLVLLSLLTVFPIVNHMDSAEAAYVPSTSTLAIVSSKETASVDVTPTSSTGTFVTSSTSDQAEFTVTTNNLTGYSLNILGTDVSGQLVNTNTGDILDTISSDTSESDFRNGSASLYSNKWGYRLNINNTTTTDFIAAPTTATSKTIYTTSSPNTTSDNYKLGIGARVDYTKPSGTYTNTFVLTAVGNPISYQINYDDTTSDTSVANIPTDEGANNIQASGFTLSSTVPTRTGYTFNKWCDGSVYHTDFDNSICYGTEYAAGASYNFSSMSGSSINTVNLKAMWNVASYNVKVNFAGVGVSSVTFTATGQTTRTVSTSGGTAALTYGIPYTMTMNSAGGYKLSSWALNDASYGTLFGASTNPAIFTANANSNNAIITVTGDKLWFQNATSADCGKTMYDNRGTAAYKNIAYTTAKIGSLCYMTRNLDLPGGTTLTNADSNITAASYTLPSSIVTPTPGVDFEDNNTAYVYNSNSTTCASGTPCYSYYSYKAATAGISVSSGNATSDICPKGWRLPTRDEYSTLANAYDTGAAMIAVPFRGVYSGSYYRGSNTDSGSRGVYWSSTSGGQPIGYYLMYGSDRSSETSPYVKANGNAVRCVQSITMQGFTSTNAANMAVGDTDIRQDERDGKEYTIAKLPDGNVWMTKNLDLSGGTTIYKSDSNITADSYTLPNSDNGPTSFSDDNTAYVYNSNSTTCAYTIPCYSYYSYAAATAGTDPSSGNATSDICPKGWRLPTQEELRTLRSLYPTGNDLTAAPFNAVYSDSYYNGSFINGGMDGFYRSSTAYSSSDAYYLDFYNSGSFVDHSIKRVGLGVRCMANI